MTKNREQKHVKMNICLNRDFFNLLQQQADNDFMRVSTWTRWYLMKNLLDGNKNLKRVTENGHTD